MRPALVIAAVLLLGAALLVAVGTNAGAPPPSCAEDMDETACHSAVGAVVRRGLPALHPLILVTRVEPGTQPGLQDLGHRATVEFDLLGMPEPLSIELYFDRGAHWGGQADHSDAEVAAWTLAPILVAGLIGVGLVAIAWRRRRSATG